MTFLDVCRVFTGTECPECRKKIVVFFNSENLFHPFTGFPSSGEYHDPCCKQLHGQLNELVARRRSGELTEGELLVRVDEFRK